jgi:hypothetical protein
LDSADFQISPPEIGLNTLYFFYVFLSFSPVEYKGVKTGLADQDLDMSLDAANGVRSNVVCDFTGVSLPADAETGRAARASTRARSCTTRGRPRKSNLRCTAALWGAAGASGAGPPQAPTDGSVASDPPAVVKSST